MLKLGVIILSFIYCGVIVAALVKRNRELFRVSLFCWAVMMVVIYYCKGGELDWLLQPFVFIWPRR